MAARLILASQSKARRRLLKRLGLSFRVCPADVDEESIQRKIKQPRKLVRVLAEMKAQAVASRFPSDVIIGSDQMLVCGRKIFGKPHTEAQARAQLRQCAGKTISLFTAVCVTGPSGSESYVHETRMKFRRLTDVEIADYVRRDQPLDCAGSFKFESYGISLFDSVETDDPSAIEGLPLISLARVLRTRSELRIQG